MKKRSFLTTLSVMPLAAVAGMDPPGALSDQAFKALLMRSLAGDDFPLVPVADAQSFERAGVAGDRRAIERAMDAASASPPGAGEFAERFKRAVMLDFANGDTVWLDGWCLSATECQAYAYLTHAA